MASAEKARKKAQDMRPPRGLLPPDGDMCRAGRHVRRARPSEPVVWIIFASRSRRGGIGQWRTASDIWFALIRNHATGTDRTRGAHRGP